MRNLYFLANTKILGDSSVLDCSTFARSTLFVAGSGINGQKIDCDFGLESELKITKGSFIKAGSIVAYGSTLTIPDPFLKSYDPESYVDVTNMANITKDSKIFHELVERLTKHNSDKSKLSISIDRLKDELQESIVNFNNMKNSYQLRIQVLQERNMSLISSTQTGETENTKLVEEEELLVSEAKIFKELLYKKQNDIDTLQNKIADLDKNFNTFVFSKRDTSSDIEKIKKLLSQFHDVNEPDLVSLRDGISSIIERVDADIQGSEFNINSLVENGEQTDLKPKCLLEKTENNEKDVTYSFSGPMVFDNFYVKEIDDVDLPIEQKYTLLKQYYNNVNNKLMEVKTINDDLKVEIERLGDKSDVPQNSSVDLDAELTRVKLDFDSIESNLVSAQNDFIKMQTIFSVKETEYQNIIDTLTSEFSDISNKLDMLKDENSQLNLNLSVKETEYQSVIDTLTSEISDISNKLDILKDENILISSQNISLSSVVVDLQNDLESSYNSDNLVVDTLTTEIKNLNCKIDLLNNEKCDLSRQLNSLLSVMDSNNTVVDTLTSQIVTLSNDSNNVRIELVTANKKILQLEDQLCHSLDLSNNEIVKNLKFEIDVLNKKVIEISGERDELQTDLDTLIKDVQGESSVNGHHNSDVADGNDHIENTDVMMFDDHERFIKLTKELDEERNNSKHLKCKLESLNKDISTLSMAYEELTANFNDLESRHKFCDVKSSDYEKYKNSKDELRSKLIKFDFSAKLKAKCDILVYAEREISKLHAAYIKKQITDDQFVIKGKKIKHERDTAFNEYNEILKHLTTLLQM